MKQRFKPSPALLVAIVALVAALAGTAVGGVAVTSLNSKDKKQVKKISKQQAKKLDKKLDKGLSKDIGDVANRVSAIENPQSGEVSLPVLTTECDGSSGWYSVPWVGARVRYRVSPSGVVRLSGWAQYCGGSETAFTLPRDFAPKLREGFVSERRLPVIGGPLSGPTERLTATVSWNGEVSVLDVAPGDLVEFSGVSFPR